MADEATINCSLQIRKVDSTTNLTLIDYQSRPSRFLADVNGTKGPSPGSLTIPVGGEAIDLGEFVTPGLCRIMNMDPTNYVEYGIWDPILDIFYPFGELLPGEITVFRFSRNIQEEYSGTGTGTTGPDNRFFMKANTADCVVLVEAFEA